MSAGESRNGLTGAAIATRVSAGRLNGLAFTFDPLSGRRLATFAPPAGTTLASANLNPAGTRVVTVESDGDAQQWDARSGRQLQSLPAATPGIEAAYSPDGSILAIVHDPVIPARITYTTVLGPVTIDLWSARTGHLLRRLSTATFDGALTPLTPASHVFGPLTFAFSANSKAIALAGVNDQALYAWGTRGGAPIEPLAIPNGDQPTSVAFSHDGHMIAAGTAAGAYVWKIAGSRPSRLPEFQHADPSQFSIELGYGVQVGFTRDSRILVTAGDWALEGWDIQDHLRLFDTYIGPYGHGALDPGGTRRDRDRPRALRVPVSAVRQPAAAAVGGNAPGLADRHAGLTGRQRSPAPPSSLGKRPAAAAGRCLPGRGGDGAPQPTTPPARAGLSPLTSLRRSGSFGAQARFVVVGSGGDELWMSDRASSKTSDERTSSMRVLRALLLPGVAALALGIGTASASAATTTLHFYGVGVQFEVMTPSGHVIGENDFPNEG